MEWPSTADSPFSTSTASACDQRNGVFGVRRSMCTSLQLWSSTMSINIDYVASSPVLNYVLACVLGSRRNPRCLRAHKPRIENPLMLPVHEVATTTYRRGGSCSVTTALLSSAARSRRAHCWLLSVLQTPSLQNLGTSADADGSASSTSALRFRGTPSRLYPRLGHVGSWNASYLSGLRCAAALCVRQEYKGGIAACWQGASIHRIAIRP